MSGSAMFDGLWPPDVTTEYGNPDDPAPELLPEEAVLVARAVPKRQREFAMGRACARAALECLGVRGHPLLSGPAGEPLWPEGLVGSLSHTKGLCVVAVASASRYQGLGVDVEPASPLPQAVVSQVCRSDEAAQLTGFGEFDRLTAARLLFSAKEAAYKCQFRLTGASLDFDELAIDLEPSGTFGVRWLARSAIARPRFEFRGRWRREASFLLTAAWLETLSVSSDTFGAGAQAFWGGGRV